MHEQQPAFNRLALGLFVAVAAGAVPMAALETPTHVLVGQRAVDSWTYVENEETRNRLDRIIREVLGYRRGLETMLIGHSVQEWIDLGGRLEDDGRAVTGSGRFYRHFHDPLQPWDSAGLLGIYDSSVRWMQNRDQTATGAAGGNWSWHDARRMYYQALTDPDSLRREALMAATFRALGQIMHLVVDASVPEHARDDPHALPHVSSHFWSYEKWVATRHTPPEKPDAFIQQFLSNPIGFDAAILNNALNGEEPATAPIARLIDSDTYIGTNPWVTFNPIAPVGPAAIGIAETANANFFSESKFGPYPPFPRLDEAGLIPVAAPRGTRTFDGLNIVRRYWTRPAGGGLLPVNPLRADCISRFLAPVADFVSPKPCVDGVVWNAVAGHMLPRAVGYARGVLEYFFRGNVQVQTSLMRVGFPFIQISNLTGEEMTGVFEIFGRPGAEEAGEGRERTAIVNGGAPATIGPYGADLREQCTTTVSTARFGFSRYPVEEREHCGWRPTRFVTDGELRTGASATVIERVSVSAPFGGAELVLDGVPVAGGVWQRRGDEPDPRRFSVRWSRQVFSVVTPAAPTLTIRLMEGTIVTSRVYGSIVADAEARKGYTISLVGSDPPWYVSATRSASIEVSQLTSYRLVSIAGYPNPTYLSINPYSVPGLAETVEADDTTRGEITIGYLQRWTDHATVYWTAPEGGPVLLQEPLREEFEALSYGPVPRVPIEAVFERSYRPGELEFLRTFVTKEQPTTKLTVVGRRPGEE